MMNSSLYRPWHPAPLAWAAAATAAAVLTACGGGGAESGPSVTEPPALTAQTLAFDTAPLLSLGAHATVHATASSGLTVRYSSRTPDICSVETDTGLVTPLVLGDCIIGASQDGNGTYAPATSVAQTLPVLHDRAQSLVFGPVPSLALFGTATVAAIASSGLAASYASNTPLICTVDAASGLVTDLAVGDCVIVASQSGDTFYDPAEPVSQTLTVAAPVVDPGRVPGTPQGVSATLSDDHTVWVRYTGLADAGSSPVLDFTASSSPAGLSATGTADAGGVAVSCPGSCAGYSFALQARNAVGSGAASTAVPVLTRLGVTVRFLEPDTQPNDSIFKGSFTLNSTTRTVTGLSGTLTESMTGSPDGSTPMTKVALGNQLSAVSDGAGSLLISSFALPTVNTFKPGGFADTVNGLYYGHPAAWNAATANSFITILVNPDAPLLALTNGQIRKLVYGDCAEGGMMGTVCMTGIYGGGTMGGYPVEQSIVVQP